jgi:hypothetical protein
MIYIIRAGDSDRYKVGYTNRSVEKRLAELQTGNPERLMLVMTLEGDIDLEERLHTMFAYCRLGGEWFEFSNNELLKIKEITNETTEISRPINGASPFDVRPVRRGQQHQPAGVRENVSRTGQGFDNPGRKHLFAPLCGEHKVSLPSVFWPGRQGDSVGDSGVHDD